MKAGAATQVILSALLVLVNHKEVPQLTLSAVNELLVGMKLFCRDCAGISVEAIHEAGKPIA